MYVIKFPKEFVIFIHKIKNNMNDNERTGLNITGSIEKVVHDYLKDNLKVETRISKERLFHGYWINNLVTTVYLNGEKIAEDTTSLNDNDHGHIHQCCG